MDKFWLEYDKNNKKKDSKLEIYKKNNANENIMRFVKLGGGPSLGSASEKYAKFTFPELQKRIKSEKCYDHVLYYKEKIIKIEQKTSTLNIKNDFMWQHVAIKHPWNILLLMSIHYNKIFFYGMNRQIFNKLVKEGKITNQGSKNKDSEQGMWFLYSSVKSDLIKINNTNDILNLSN
jgi:hypothetical protein